MIIRATSDTDKAGLIEWLAPRLSTTPADLVWTYPFEIVGCLRDGVVIGACLYMHHRGYSIEAHWSGERGWLTRENLTGMFGFPFVTLGVRRINGLIPKRNKVARETAVRLGFKLEGCLREANDDGRDLMIYGMLRHECRWLAKGAESGQGQCTEVRRRGSGRIADRRQ